MIFADIITAIRRDGPHKVSVAGVNAKLLMLTALGPAEAGAGAVSDAGACGAAPDTGDAPPVIPGVTLACGPKLIDGCESAAGPALEQPDSSRAVAIAAIPAGAVRGR